MTDPAPPTPHQNDDRTANLRKIDACQHMADLCRELHAFAPDLSPREFLRVLAALVAGIDLGLKGFEQLARGGANGLVGAGFRPEYDDGSAGQARHFAGTAAGAALLGEKPAELLAHHVVDPAESIDGHLSSAALEFARVLIDGELPLDRAGSWIESHICDPRFEPERQITPFDALEDESQTTAALRARFSDAEWQTVIELPAQVAIAAALSDPTGDLDDARDLIAGIRQLESASGQTSPLVRAVTADHYETGFAWTSNDLTPAAQVDQVLRSVAGCLLLLPGRGVATADIDAYASLLLSVAHAAVRGSKSGGFLGIGGQEISSPESAFLDRLETVLESHLPGCADCME